MKTSTQIGRIWWLAVCLVWLGVLRMPAVTVTLLTDKGVSTNANLRLAEQNLGAVLTEINRAQRAGDNLTTRSLPMDEFSVKSLARIWAVTPFYCDDDEIVERVWVFKDGSLMVSHIPLIITPKDDNFGYGTYQEAVVEMDSRGNLTDFRLSLNAQMGDDLQNCRHSVKELENQMIIMQQIERFRTAYNQKDIEAIDRMFSDDALIITGKVVMAKTGSDNVLYQQKVEYTRQNKQQYISNLRRAFARNKWIDVKFSMLDAERELGCAGITRSTINPTMYGVRLRQEWRSSNYSDEGYLFLLWEFPADGRDPIIHVRTWQPESVAGKIQPPDDSISTLSGFDL